MKAIKKLYQRFTNVGVALLVAVTGIGSAPLLWVQQAVAAPVTVNNQTELINALADNSYDVISLGQNITTTQELVINRPLTLNGSGFTISPNFSFVSNSADNSVIEILSTSGITLSNLTVEGAGGSAIHGINIYEATNVQLQNIVSRNNDKSGVVVNSSNVTVTNVTTAGNSWHGINVDKKTALPAVLTVHGTSNQTDVLPIYVDNATLDITVNDTQSQYYAVAGPGSSKIYFLKPIGHIAAPSSGQLVSGTLNLAATYQDWDNGVNDDGVQWAVRAGTCASGTGTVAGNVDSFSSPYSWDGATFAASINVSAWTDGVYCFVFNPSDDAGQPDVRKTQTFTVDKTAPAVPVHVSPANTSVQNFNDFYFDWTTVADAVEYEFQAATNPATDGNGALTTGVWNNKLHGAPDRHYLTDSQIHSYGASGTWYWQVRAIDAAGNKSAWTTPWHMTIDMATPTAPVIIFPANEQYFNTAPILNDWDPSTDTNGIGKYQIAYQYDDGHSFGSSTCDGSTLGIGDSGKFLGCRDVTAPTTQRNHAPSTGEQGGVTIWVRAQDTAGNWSAWSTPVHYYYDATPPAVPVLLSPANGTPINGSSPVAHDWQDVAGIHHYVYQSYEVDGSGNCNLSAIRFTGSFTESQTNSRVLADGLTFCWRVKAVDAAGNQSSWSEPWKTIADNSGPDVDILSFGQNNNQIQPNLTAADPSMPLTYLWQAHAGNPGVAVFTPNVAMPVFTVTINGTYNFTLTVTDAAGNVTTVPFSFTYTAPTVPPEETETPAPQFAGVATTTGNPAAPVTLLDDDTGADDPEILGATTDQSNNPDVDSASTAADQVANMQTSSNKFLGLGWWWLAVLGAFFLLWIFFAARRSEQQ